jgi:hypothetical protein
MTPGAETFVPRHLIERRMERHAGFTRKQLGLRFQSKDWRRWLH